MKPSEVTWETLDWEALDRLRETFLAGRPPGGSYWKAPGDLASYDLTFAQRIGWKWDAVIAELQQRGWSPPAGTLLDWGCGSGIAGRCVLDGWSEGNLNRLEVFDHSALAMNYAEAKARSRFPAIPVQQISKAQCSSAPPAPRTLLISHVLNELDEAGGQSLRGALDHAAAVIWVEPGTYADSRSLIAMREALLGDFEVIAPCTHQARCGLLESSNERHWCHHFTAPPAGLLADANWVQFSRRAGIDLRAIPYSFLVLERKGLRDPIPGLLPDGCSRVIGRARLYKGFAKIQSCQEDGVRDLELQKRDCPDVFKAFSNDRARPVYRWRTDGRWIREAGTLD